MTLLTDARPTRGLSLKICKNEAVIFLGFLRESPRENGTFFDTAILSKNLNPIF